MLSKQPGPPQKAWSSYHVTGWKCKRTLCSDGGSGAFLSLLRGCAEVPGPPSTKGQERIWNLGHLSFKTAALPGLREASHGVTGLPAPLQTLLPSRLRSCTLRRKSRHPTGASHPWEVPCLVPKASIHLRVLEGSDDPKRRAPLPPKTNVQPP